MISMAHGQAVPEAIFPVGRSTWTGADEGEMSHPLGLGAEFENVCAGERVDDAAPKSRLVPLPLLLDLLRALKSV
jgi:hypothetical protein